MKSLINKIKSFYKNWKYKQRYNKYCKQFENKPHSFGRMDSINVNGSRIRVGEKCHFFKNVTFYGGFVQFGDKCAIGDNTIIFSCGDKSSGGGIYFGNNVLIAANCAFYDSDHSFKKGININEQPLKLSPIIVEDDVWFGTGCIVLRGSIIRKGAVIGAGSVVKGEIPENAIAVGVPAKVIKYRSE